MNKLNKVERKALLGLSQEHASKSKFVTVLDKQSIDYILDNGAIYLSDDSNSYMILENQRIISIYSAFDSYNHYQELLSHIKSNAQYIAPIRSTNLTKALKEASFKIIREHHQLVKELVGEYPDTKLEFLPLASYSSRKIINLIKEAAPKVNYTIKEIDQAKKSSYSFAYQDLKAACIAYQNPLGLYLEEIVVKNEYQNQGIGREMLNYLHFKASKDYDKICLHVYNDNIRAYELYKKLGYKLEKVIAYWER